MCQLALPTTHRAPAPRPATPCALLRAARQRSDHLPEGANTPGQRGANRRVADQSLPSLKATTKGTKWIDGDQMDRSERSWSVVRAFNQLNGDFDEVTLTDQRYVDCVACLAIADRSNDSG